jgi:hypothetical protein
VAIANELPSANLARAAGLDSSLYVPFPFSISKAIGLNPVQNWLSDPAIRKFDRMGIILPVCLWFGDWFAKDREKAKQKSVLRFRLMLRNIFDRLCFSRWGLDRGKSRGGRRAKFLADPRGRYPGKLVDGQIRQTGLAERK